MAKTKKLNVSKISADRKKLGINQKDFWKQYGITSQEAHAMSLAGIFQSLWQS